MKRIALVSSLASLTLLLAACGGSSGDGKKVDLSGVTGLEGPDELSVIAPDSEGPAGDTEGPAAFPPDSDYVADVADVHVYDPSMEALENINQILCLTSLTAYDEMVNEGAYLALVDESLCETGSDDGGDQGQSSSNATEMTVFTVNSKRNGKSANQKTNFWVPITDGPNDGEGTIYARMIMSRGVTDADPFGVFHMAWAMVDAFSSLESPIMTGAMSTIDADSGLIGFQFYENAGDVDLPHTPGGFSFRSQVTVEMTTDQTRGAARVARARRFDDGGGDMEESEEWELVYNQTHVKRRRIDEFGVPGPTVTLSRETYDDRVWRYNLYHNEGPDLGARVELESGFGFRTELGEYGWIGYWGMWTPEGVDVQDGDVITRDDHTEQDGDLYTVVEAPGRLIHRTRSTMDFADLGGQIFHWWSDAQYQVDHDGVDFRKVAVWNEGTESWDPIEPPVAIDVAAEGGYLNMWSEMLGGPVSYALPETFITYFQEQFVDGDHPLMGDAVNGRVQLFGLLECLRAGLTGADAEAGDVYLPDAPDTDPANANVYRLGVADLTLYHDPNRDESVLDQVGLLDGEEPASGPYMWGMRTGPLVTDLTGLTNVWDIWNVAEYYVYETGHNDWNHFVTVQDSLGAYVSFDAPIQFLYTHTTADDRNGDATYDGQKFVLSYAGAGNLWGIPHEGVDLSGDGEPDRWYPLFSIADGTLMGPSGTEYAARGLEIEQTLEEDPGGAPGLNVDDAAGLVLPDSSLYETPDMDDPPVITAPPKVINGEIVGS